MQIPRLLDLQEGACDFPDVSRALVEPNGLLAVGGKLSPECLMRAYRHGIFPWYSEDQPILWWSPDPRMVLFPHELRVSRSLRKTLRRGQYRITLDEAFPRVIKACAAQRQDDEGTWITAEMMAAYCQLHHQGVAHSVEAWCDGELVGGLYGVAIGKVFFGESMFHRRRDASKVAFVTLVAQLSAWGYGLIDCQVATEHLASLGAREISRQRFIQLLGCYCEEKGRMGPWCFGEGSDPLHTPLEKRGGF